MNASHHHDQSSSIQRHHQQPDDVRRLLSAAHTVLEQPPPPTLRDILAAYRTKGEGDRDMLLAMLNAKTAEDQRLASVTSLQRTLLEIHKNSSEPPTEHDSTLPPPNNSSYLCPAPISYTQSSRPYDQPSPRRSHHRNVINSRSPPPNRTDSLIPQLRDPPISQHLEHPRKRHRSTHSPRMSHANFYESPHSSEQFPPSPYSSSDRSDSAEYSPRSRGSMTIGSLLSSGPSREIHGEYHSQERE